MQIPADILPVDGRFGSGPSKVPAAAMEALAASGPHVIGTSHRQSPVRNLVGSVREGLRSLFTLPDEYEVVLGVGGSTAFFDAATFGLIRERSQHLAFGEFGTKFATAAQRAPFLGDPTVVRSEPGTHPDPYAEDGIDVYAWPHNETSTGVSAPVRRVDGADPDALHVIDGTSAAGALPVDVTQCDVYYFAPQKALASDAGVWFALMSPAALARVEEIAASGRWVPAFLDLGAAVQNSAKDQTLNTPPLASLFWTDQQIRWILDNGGLSWSVSRCEDSASRLYGWAEQSSYATPFVTDPGKQSTSVVTIDLEGVDAGRLSRELRAAGIVDVDGYRGLNRNQLRIATYPAVDPEDCTRLTQCIDWVVERLTD
ncbi:phosphoserine aminotransferase [Mumia flava]|uniref:phosphoserine transaminase n=1 Tax=Mumia flava TaxID=1348852 RepID=A0A0B2BSJ9_9ACTN|nr:phosphoserine transaminase [Mumia flava]PJJ56956.1 phosphoserine aminotransferase [Mumia flava]